MFLHVLIWSFLFAKDSWTQLASHAWELSGQPYGRIMFERKRKEKRRDSLWITAGLPGIYWNMWAEKKMSALSRTALPGCGLS